MQHLDYITLIAAIGFMWYAYLIRARGASYIILFKLLPTVVAILLLLKFATDIGFVILI